MRRTRTLVLPLVVAAATTMVACGDDGNDSNTEETPVADTQPESSPAPEESETPTSDATAQSAAGEDPDIGTEEPSDTGAEGEDTGDDTGGGSSGGDSGGDSGGG